MFDSGVTASNLISDLKNEIYISNSISNATYVIWLNILEQMLYGEIIKEQKKITIDSNITNPVLITALIPGTGENSPTFDDIHKIYLNGEIELTKSDIHSVFDNVYWKENNSIAFKPIDAESIDIIYFVKPALKTVDSSDVIQSGIVMVPYEFLELVKAKLRAEAYKLANEFVHAANWINDYNVLLEVFKGWIKSKSPIFHE